MASTYLTRTFGTATNRKIWTWSAWVKRQNLVSDHTNAMFGAYTDGSNRSVIRFHGHVLEFQDSGNSVQIKTNRLFRDMNAWYHIVARVDTTQGTASDRVRLYVNGEQQTSFSQADYPNQNVNMEFQNSVVHYINARHSGSAVDSIADMSYSHVHFADGQSLAPTVFGSTDSTTGEWQINTSPSFTLGTNGFTILKDGNTITDQSANSNNFTLGGGTLTKTEDCPSNVFATINPLDNFYNGLTITNGNTSWVSGSPYSFTRSTLGASSGKYYFEMKVVNEGNTDYEFGIVGSAPTSTSSWMGSSGTYGYAYESNAELRANGTTVDPWGSTYDDGDILGCAFDLDNNKIYFSKNGSWQQSGDPSAGSNGYTIVASADTTAGAYFVGAGDFSGSGGQSGQFNFGNGYFGTTAVSSAGTNASGNGIFEYDVPTGYTALSTKGLNT